MTYRPDAAIGGAIALVVFAVYAAGACRTIYVGDSGELVSAVHLLGIPHPSGYPLYVLLGKVWTLVLPIGSIAYRMSLFSAACGALACGVLYRACREVPVSRGAAVTAALVLAFSSSLWGEATVQRVYTLNVLFVALITWLAIRWHRERSLQTMAAAFLCAGIGATNHTVMAVCAVAVLAYMLVEDRRLVRRRWHLAAAGSAFLLGLLPYAYLPLRSRADPALDWGNPETLQSFLTVVLRRNFWARRWYEGPWDLITAGHDYLASLAGEATWVGGALALTGIVAGWRRRWPVLLATLVMAGNFLAVALHGSRSDIFIWHRYYLPSYVMVGVLVALGCQAVSERLPRGVSYASLLIPLVLFISGYREFDRSRYRIAEDFSRQVLRELPPGARLIASDDNILFVLMYLHLVEGMRPDVDLILEGVGGATLPPVRFDPDTDPLFLTHHPSWNVDGLETAPVGLLFRTVRSGRARPPVVLGPAHLAGELDARVPKDYLTRNLIGHYHYMRGVTLEAHDWAQARQEFDRAAVVASENDVLFYNLGLIFRANGLLGDALAAFRRAEVINPRSIPGSEGPLASEQVQRVLIEASRVREIEGRLAADPSMRDLPATSPSFHERIAVLLERRGELAAARGHRLTVLEMAASARGEPVTR